MTTELGHDKKKPHMGQCRFSCTFYILAIMQPTKCEFCFYLGRYNNICECLLACMGVFPIWKVRKVDECRRERTAEQHNVKGTCMHIPSQLLSVNSVIITMH